MSDEYEEKIAKELRNIFDRQLEAMRRAGVAEGKEEGLRIESTEAIRLFREATGYILRLRELRDDIGSELHHAEYYHVERIIGHLDDYNRTLQAIRRNPSFENSIQDFDDLSFSHSSRTGNRGYQVTLENRTVHIPATHHVRHQGEQTHVPMDGTTSVETVVLPRLIRLTKDVEQSLIGRCASGKRPD